MICDRQIQKMFIPNRLCKGNNLFKKGDHMKMRVMFATFLFVTMLLFCIGCSKPAATTTTTLTIRATTTSTSTSMATTTSSTSTSTHPVTTTTTLATTVTVPSLTASKSSQTFKVSDYPRMFVSGGNFNALIVTSTSPPKPVDVAVEMQSATAIISGLSGCCNVVTGTGVLDTDVSDDVLASRDMVVLGNPCSNSAVARIVGVDKAHCNSAGLGLVSGKSLIKLYEKNGHKYLLVLGPTSDETKLGAKVLQNYQGYDLTGATIEILGSVSNPVAKVLN